MEKFDIAVIGGGFSGVAAAISAARLGKKVILCEQSGALGGAMNNCLVYPFMDYWTLSEDKTEKKYLSAGLFKEMLVELKNAGGYITETRYNPDIFKITLDRMTAAAGVTVLFHAKLFEVKTENASVKSAVFAVKNGTVEIAADFFVDATGDGDLCAFAGCEMQLGREEDNLCQPMTTCFRLSGIDLEKFKLEKPQMQELYKEYQQQGKITNPRENILTFYGIGEDVVHFNTTRVVKLNPTNPFEVSKAEAIAREQILELLNFLRENFSSCKKAVLVSSAADIGVRESRMLKGMHILTAKEIMDCTKFTDGIALGNYDIDIHNPEGAGTSHYYFPAGQYYRIPYASLVPNEFNNLLTCGRCISATHEAQASIRIMPICATTGEAAGTACALALDTNTDNKTIDVNLLRDTLRNNGAAVD